MFKLIHITGDSVSFACNATEPVPFCQLMIHRNVTFLYKLICRYICRHSILLYLYVYEQLYTQLRFITADIVTVILVSCFLTHSVYVYELCAQLRLTTVF